MAALDSAHAALALGAPTLLVARMSSGSPRARHRGISHHTLTVLDLLLEPVTVALPAGMRSPVGADLRAGLGSVFGGALPSGRSKSGAHGGTTGRCSLTLSAWRGSRVTTGGGRSSTCRPDAAAGVPSGTMGRGLTEYPWFRAALAVGVTLASRAGRRARRRVAWRRLNVEIARPGTSLKTRRSPGVSRPGNCTTVEGAVGAVDGRAVLDRVDSGGRCHVSPTERGAGTADARLLPRRFLSLEPRPLEEHAPPQYRSESCLQFGEFLDRRGRGDRGRHGDLAAFLFQLATVGMDAFAVAATTCSARPRACVVLPSPAPRGSARARSRPPT